MAIYATNRIRDKILIAPNKCASTWVETVLQKDQFLDRQAASKHSRNADTRNYLLVRDPVEWYVSGYRYCSWFMLEAAETNAVNLHMNSFEQHLELCFQRAWLASSGHMEILRSFDWHAWINPLYSAQGRFHNVGQLRNSSGNMSHDVKPIKIHEHVKIEDTPRLTELLREFALPRANEAALKTKSNVSSYSRPQLSDRSKDLIKALDDWSATFGYDVHQSIEDYNTKYSNRVP
tara:strand:+ start:2486 stop:3187 length:702 start_codon:yes stop_codon:yes gene_type:complete